MVFILHEDCTKSSAAILAVISIYNCAELHCVFMSMVYYFVWLCVCVYVCELNIP